MVYAHSAYWIRYNTYIFPVIVMYHSSVAMRKHQSKKEIICGQQLAKVMP